MRSIKNTKNHYGLVSIILHWFMAVLIITLLTLGFYMATLPNTGFDIVKFKLIYIHKELGTLALILVSIRLIWRLFNVTPLLPSHTPPWQKFAARTAHFALYGFMFAQPITGWLMSSAAGFPMTFLGLVKLPALISPNIHKLQLFIELHKWIAYGLMITICVHIGAALIHHFIDKDDTIQKMLP